VEYGGTRDDLALGKKRKVIFFNMSAARVVAENLFLYGLGLRR
jgi:hypothetical protein